jgi:hypothetical protein
MAKKTIYKTVIMLEVLSEEPIPDGMTLGDIDRECEEGMYTGRNETTVFNKPVKGKRAAEAVKRQGSDPSFLNMDENGNEIEFEF